MLSSQDLAKYKALNVQIVGVSVDTPDKTLDFKNKYGLDFLLLSDKNAVVADAYGSKLDIPILGKFANRQTYVIDNKGVIVKEYLNVEGSVSKHSTEILSYLNGETA